MIGLASYWAGTSLAHMPISSSMRSRLPCTTMEQQKQSPNPFISTQPCLRWSKALPERWDKSECAMVNGIERLFEMELIYKQGLPSISSAESRLGEYIGSGEGKVTG